MRIDWLNGWRRPGVHRLPRAGVAAWLAFWSLSALLLSGCGFQLRGLTELPPGLQSVYLAAEPASADFEDALRVGLRSAGSRLLEAPSAEGSTLKILKASEDRRVLSVNSVTGKVQEYELIFSVRFAVADGAGTTLVESQDIHLRRDFRFSETEVLGKSQEEAQLKREMRSEMVQSILRRLQAQLS